MEKTAQAMQSAQDLFTAQLSHTAWQDAATGPQMLEALSAALAATHQQVRSQYPGDLVKLNACDALFRQARAGLAVTAAALAEPEQSAEAPVTADRPALPAKGKHAPNVLHAAVLAAMLALFVLLALLLRYTTAYGTVELPAYLFANALLALLLLMIGWELLFRIGRLRAVLDEEGMGGLVTRLGKALRLQWLAKLGASMSSRYRSSLAQWQFGAPVQVIEKPAVPQRDKLLQSCLELLRIIDSNLPLFAAPQQAVQKADYSPLLRALIQESYSNRGHMSAELLAMLNDQLRSNGWTLLDYAPEHEHLFTTQPMSETFTIFPAIMDEQQQLIETGFACVKEE